MRSAVIPSRGRESALWRRFVMERLHRLFALVLVLQLIQCFEGYWWTETYRVLYVTLGVYGVTELLISRALIARLTLQLLAAVISTLAFTPFQWYGWPLSWRQWAYAGPFLKNHGEQLHPYVELAAGAILVTHVIAAWGTSRARTIALIVISVIVLASVDSFYPLELWPHIAVTVLAGLGWLVVIHMRMLRDRHYDSWDALAARPFELIVPAAAVIGLLVLIGVTMPRAPVLLEDPYTLWMEAQNRDVPSSAGEGGYLINGSFLSSGSSGSSKSGYGRNDAEIGGGFEFDYSPVMSVATNEKSYWRGETKAVYTGKGWTDVKGTPSSPVTLGSDNLPLSPERTQQEGIREIVQTVKMVREDRIPVLFAAGPASAVEEIEGVSNPKLFWNSEEWELRFQRPIQVESYTVVSQVQELDENKLRSLSGVTSYGKSSIELTPYLQLPESLPDRVGELAKQATAGAANDYDRLKMLEQYLKDNYTYTNTPDTSKQKSDDVVDAFLFEIQEGYCDYYSTAFVVMARTLGIPTRWVKGYTAGSSPVDEEAERYGYMPDPSGAGTYTVRNSDAHSWAEAYFEGYGWVSFEPTSGFSIPVPVHQDAPVIAPTTAEPTPATEVDAPVAAASHWQQLVIYSAFAVILLAIAALAVFKRRKLASVWKKLVMRRESPNEQIVREMERLVRFMQRKGFRRNPHDTLRETVTDWGGRYYWLRQDLDSILLQFESARYGGHHVDEETSRRFSQSAERIRKAL
ncbi:transglutaminaseTgpA domain-containing protein [Cohnella lubricantis]|uniref:Transglutaminase domain-containing protein n=1 Tax=Cohnella lubricantis TaxID=2163172 RepID=A0A841T8N5_9BACL|nr:transglutaminaseTgpA domain-containing protein [Cohnella lubricantis]MBB6675788.1 transglutaminase domain-containing protein [Cohnella lubricantis]MBP2119863.1 transglutaminase-like putative cysteine protease [Cohnella lubricantis]